jgi:parallel beta-helix repeat protein
MAGQPAAFMSYARFDDQHDDGQLTAFRERLAAEVRMQTGEKFLIFQDRTDIAWGENWQQRINQALDTVTLILEDNDITANAYPGVGIRTGGNPTLRRNRINRNEYQAIWVHEGGKGVVEDNDLTDNKRGAWDIAADSEGNVTRARNRVLLPVAQGRHGRLCHRGLGVGRAGAAGLPQPRLQPGPLADHHRRRS